ncbi:MAG: hypothetical protein ACRDZT_02870, partial [Acidimicrobiales bacterium]
TRNSIVAMRSSKPSSGSPGSGRLVTDFFRFLRRALRAASEGGDQVYWSACTYVGLVRAAELVRVLGVLRHTCARQ